MSKSRKSHGVDVFSQLESAVRRPQAAMLGAVIGGIVPWFARTLAHSEIPAAWSAGNMGMVGVVLAVVLGCALFSALTVYKFGLSVFGDPRKAVGFTLALEGVVIVAHGDISVIAMIVVVAINALANGAAIANSRDQTCKRRASAARASASRARRSAPRAPQQPAQPAPASSWRVGAEDAVVVGDEKWLS